MRKTALQKMIGILGSAGVMLALMTSGPVFAQAKNVAPGGDIICKGCHESYVETYLSSKHGQKGNTKGPDCQTCHANSLEHAKAGGGKGAGGIFSFSDKKVPADKKAEVCLSCHEGDRQLTFWDSGKHKKNDVSCNNCHSLHGAPKDPSISPYVTTVRKLQYETCNNCHKDKRAQILKPSHHPIVEGKVKCSDCHNPHGALSKAMIKSESVNDLCYTCHAEKRGPYIAEHPPVAENCLNCHAPHGSQHSRLLNERMPLLCQDCHTGASHLGTIWNQKDAFVPLGSTTLVTATTSATTGATSAAGARFITRSCTNCHNNIHGSMAPQSPGQRFRR